MLKHKSIEAPCFEWVDTIPQAVFGPTHLGPAWAHPLGPSLGPPTWAQLRPTQVGTVCCKVRHSSTKVHCTAPAVLQRNQISAILEELQDLGRSARVSYLFREREQVSISCAIEVIVGSTPPNMEGMEIVQNLRYEPVEPLPVAAIYGWSGPKPEIWDLKKNPKIKSSQNQNPFCPNCRRGFFMPEKGVPAPFGALPAHFFRRPEKSKNCSNFAYFPWWAHGPYSPALGPLLLSTRGGAIGTHQGRIAARAAYCSKAETY